MFSPTISSVTNSPMSTPGSMALETAKNMKDLSIFKTPRGPAKRSKAKVLDEDTYVEKIGEIIQRDFFPDLEKLKAQNEYIDALESNDTKKMRELFEKYSFERPRTSERLASPATFETPVHKENSSEDTPKSTTSTSSKAKEPKIEERKVGLDEFLSTNTSEDNASFEEILVENEKKHRIKYAWLYKSETEPNILAIENNNDKLLAIESGNKKRPFHRQ